MNELLAIQQELKAPKSNYNQFGKYKYRSAEGILEAVKPLLGKYKCTLTITDDVVMLGHRFYLKATATLTGEEGREYSTSAYAREEETKKGMDGSQITGTASSYARKYALNGLFAIDDTKDADALNTTPEYTSNHDDMAVALQKVAAAKSRDELKVVWDEYAKYKGDPIFLNAVTARGKEVQG